MTRHPAFRLFLMLVLLLNGLAVAHAAAGHAFMQSSAPAAPSHVHIDAATMAAMDDCHDMAMHDDAPAPHAPVEHKGAPCCQGNVCDCAGAVQLPVGLSVLVLVAPWQSVPPALTLVSYRSTYPALIFRPPIA